MPAAGSRTSALTALLTRLVTRGRGAPVKGEDIAHARSLLIAQHFAGDEAAYRAALEQRNIGAGLVDDVIADQFRYQAAEAALATSDPGRPIGIWAATKVRSAVRSAICARDELPDGAVFSWPKILPFLEIPWASVSISADAPSLKRGDSATLSGAVVSARASERVTIYARTSGGSYAKIGTTGVDAGGSWRFTVSPTSFTTYKAVTKSAGSRPVAVRVRRPPRGK